MDKILSARVDESVLHHLNMLAKRLNTSKKSIIEGAIMSYVDKYEKEKGVDVLAQTAGAWQRDETAAETFSKARSTFTRDMERHQE